MDYNKSLAVNTPHVIGFDAKTGFIYNKDLAIATPHVVNFDARAGINYSKSLTIYTPHVVNFFAHLGATGQKALFINTPHVVYFDTHLGVLYPQSLVVATYHNFWHEAAKQPGASTGVVTAFVKKQKPKVYIYHGQVMSCVQPPQPKFNPGLIFALKCAFHPSMFNYEADVFPEDFTPPYIIEQSTNVTPSILNGILYLNPVPGQPYGPGYDVVEGSVGYFANYMRYELGGPFFPYPHWVGSNDEYAGREIYFYSRTDSDNFIHFIQEFWWDGAHWINLGGKYEVYTFVYHNWLIFPTEYNGFYLDLTYDPILDKTTADYNGLVTEEFAGKITLYPAFYAGSHVKFPAQQIDFERITGE